jgi:hypothetical protein
MCSDPAPQGERPLMQALNYLQAAIELLDRGRAPGHIAAHVDLAAHQLRDAIRSEAGEIGSDCEEGRAPLTH